MEFIQRSSSMTLNRWGEVAAPPLGIHPIEEFCPICGAHLMTCTGESHGPVQQEAAAEVVLEVAIGIAGADAGADDPFAGADARDEREPVRYDDGRYEPDPDDSGGDYFIPFIG